MRFLARIRAWAGQLILIATLTLVAGALLIGAPRAANQLEDKALRARIESLPQKVKDITFRSAQGDQNFTPMHAEARLEEQRAALGATLAQHIEQSWFGVTVPVESTIAHDHGLDGHAKFGLRAGSDLFEASELVAGRWPDNTLDLPRLEVALSEISAKILNQAVGSDFTIISGKQLMDVRVVGIFRPLDDEAAVWEPEPLALKAYAPQQDGEAYLALYLTDIPGVTKAHVRRFAISYEWRYRLGLSILDMAALPTLIPAILDGRTKGIDASKMETGVDTALARFADDAKSAQSMFAVVQAATLATIAGLVLLASRLAVTRRHRELTLLRARGATLRTIGWRILAESAPLVGVAAFAGWFMGRLVPGRPAGTEPLLATFTAIALLATPVLAMFSLRRFIDEREDFATTKVGARQRTAEIGLVVLAAVGSLLLRRRGLSAELDVFLVTVPVLLAAATGVAMLRAVPAPLAFASRIAARGKGMVSFLGLARAGRSAPATIGPIAVLVVAVCTTVFSIGIAGTVANGRDRATDHDIPGDAIVHGFYFAPDTREAIGELPAVSAVASFAVMPATRILASREIGALRLGQTYVLVMDGPAFAEAAAAAGRQVRLDNTIVTAEKGRQITPALISPTLARTLGEHSTGVISLQGHAYDFSVGAVVESFPTIPRTATSFLVLPWQALPIPPDRPLNPTGFLVSGQVDPDALTSAGDAGQTRWITKIRTPKIGYEPVTGVTTWEQRRAELELTGVNSVLTFSYGMGALAGVVLALLAVGFAVLAGAAARGKVLSRLRTMGLSRGQGRRLLMVELAPMVIAAVLAGGAVGLGLPWLVGPALKLSSFTDGYDGGLRLDPLLIAGAAVLIMAGLGTAVAVETLFNRRLRLGEVLRLGSTEQE